MVKMPSRLPLSDSGMLSLCQRALFALLVSAVDIEEAGRSCGSVGVRTFPPPLEEPSGEEDRLVFVP